jgi:hypothetical protein
MFAHLIDTYGAIELDQVHRFSNRWEREASLRLRDSDPSVLDEYHRQGRLHDGTHDQMETSAVAGNVRGVGSALFGSGSRILPVDVFVDGRKRGWEGSGS